MENFEFRNPTKIIFGRGAEENVGTEAALYSKKILCISAAAASRPPACMTALPILFKKPGSNGLSLAV